MGVKMISLVWEHFPVTSDRKVEAWEADHPFGCYLVEFYPDLSMPFQWVQDECLMKDFASLQDAMNYLRGIHLRQIQDCIHGEVSA